MRSPKKTWDINIANVKHMHWLHQKLCKLLPAMDLNDILRSEIVLVVSAFDCYIHDIVLSGMNDMFSSNKVATKHYNDFCLPMSIVNQLLSTNDKNIREQIYHSSVKKLLAKDSYQAPSSIEYAMNILNVKKIWSLIGKQLGIPPSDVRKELAIIIQRRNKIAHEADIQDFVSMDKNPISRFDVENVISFLDNVVNVIENNK